MERIEECLKNAKKISEQIDDNIEYNKFIHHLKELVDKKEIDETNVKNPFTYLLEKLPEKYHKYVNMMYKNYFKKMNSEYKKINSYYLGESLLSDEGKIIVPLSNNNDIDEFCAYGIAMLYYGGIYKKMNS